MAVRTVRADWIFPALSCINLIFLSATNNETTKSEGKSAREKGRGKKSEGKRAREKIYSYILRCLISRENLINRDGNQSALIVVTLALYNPIQAIIQALVQVR